MQLILVQLELPHKCSRNQGSKFRTLLKFHILCGTILFRYYTDVSTYSACRKLKGEGEGNEKEKEKTII